MSKRKDEVVRIKLAENGWIVEYSYEKEDSKDPFDCIEETWIFSRWQDVIDKTNGLIGGEK